MAIPFKFWSVRTELGSTTTKPTTLIRYQECSVTNKTAKAGIQEKSGCRIKSGITELVSLFV
ncbi:MAG: hypothetical protein V2J65_16515 [Desulfobacteraceae bacterium]|nr:hypothetical protein [Desulfobacteraceae bacterium]